MYIPFVLLPVFVQVALMFAVLGVLFARRNAAFRKGDIAFTDIALGQHVWPADAQQAANSWRNQFELPVLFFALVPLAIITHKADLQFVLFSWAFVILRVAHAIVHLTFNDVRARGPLFGLGAIVLFLMWAILAVRILAAL